METKKAVLATKLTEIAKAKLVGKVCVTDARGVTHEYADEVAAFEAWKDRVVNLEYRRGAFFEKTTETAPADEAPKPVKRKQ